MIGGVSAALPNTGYSVGRRSRLHLNTRHRWSWGKTDRGHRSQQPSTVCAPPTLRAVE